MYNNDNWYPESNRENPNSGKLPTKRFRPRHLGMIIALGTLGLLVVLLGSTTLFLWLSQQNKSQLSVATSVAPTPTPVAPQVTLTPTSTDVTATAASTETPTLTDTPTTSGTQKTITENKQFTCADCQNKIFYIKIVLEKVIMDSSDQTMTFQFHFTNTSSTDSFNTYFAQLYLQDNVDGSRYGGQGDDVSRSFDLAPGNDVIVLPSFLLAPKQGRGYTLHLRVNGGNAATMKNEVFTF